MPELTELLSPRRAFMPSFYLPVAGAGGAATSGALGAAAAGAGAMAPGLLGLLTLFEPSFSWDKLRQSPMYQQYMSGFTQPNSSTTVGTGTGTELGSGGLAELLSILGAIGTTQMGDDPAGNGDPTNSKTTTAANTGGLAGTLQKLLKLSPGTAQLISQLGGLGLSALGTGLQGQANARAQELLGNAANQYSGWAQDAMSTAKQGYGDANAGFKGIMAGQDPWSSLMLGGLLPASQQYNDLIPQLMQRNFATESPQIQNALQTLLNNAQSGGLQSMLDYGQGTLANSGRTADTRDTVAQYKAMQTGATPAMARLLDSGAGFLGNQGMTNALSQILGGGAGTVAQGGMTPEVANALKQVQGLLAGGGATGATNALTGLGLKMAGKDALLPMQQVLSNAEDEAATRVSQGAETARAQALARGGGPGATVANGVANAGLADFATQGNQAVAQAVRDAMEKQQGLGLQQQGLGAQMAGQGQSLEAQRLAELLNSVSNLTATSTGRMSVGGNLALGANQGATQRASLGGNLLEGYNQGSLGAGSLINTMLGLEMGNASQWGGLLNQGAGTQASMLSDYVAKLLSGAAGGAQAGAQQGGLYQGNLENLRQLLSGGQSNYLNANQGLYNGARDWLGYSSNQADNVGRILTNQAAFAQNSPWGAFLNNTGAGLMSSGTTPTNTKGAVKG